MGNGKKIKKKTKLKHSKNKTCMSVCMSGQFPGTARTFVFFFDGFCFLCQLNYPDLYFFVLLFFFFMGFVFYVS
jgi:hypothetical protein